MAMTLPRVTAILNDLGLSPDFSGIPPAVLDAARDRGVALHQAVEAVVYGYLDEGSLSPDVMTRLDAYRKFITESGYTTTHTEIRVEHPAWGYCGHPDSIGWLSGKRTLLDWKAIDSLDVAPASYQLAAYALAWDASHPKEPIAVAGVVQLKSDGRYSFHEIDRAEAERIWLCAVAVYHAKRQRRAA